MSQENVDLVMALQPSGVDLVAVTGGEEPFAEIPDSLFEEDFRCSFTAAGARAEIGPSFGVEGLVTAWRDWLEPWGTYEIEAERFLDVGDRVVAFVRVRGRTRRDKVYVEHTPAAVWSLRDGTVQAIDFYLEREEALKAVGLEE